MSSIPSDAPSAKPALPVEHRLSQAGAPTLAPQKPRLRRAEVPAYLMEKHGYPIAVATLNKMASAGGSPPMVFAGRIPLYPVDLLDAWVEAKLSKPVNSTAERDA